MGQLGTVLARPCAQTQSTSAGSEPVALEAAVEGAPREAERLRGPADIAVVAGERLLDEEALHFLEAHVVEAGLPLAPPAQAQVVRLDLGARGHEHGALHRVVQL